MRPRRIILVRHAESKANVDRMINCDTPDHAIPLTLKGRQQAEKAGKKIAKLLEYGSAYVYTSVFTRTMETWKYIAGELPDYSVLRVIPDPRLREQEWGNFFKPDQIDQIYKDREAIGSFFYRFPDGESGADVYDRISTFLETMHRDFAKDDYPDNAIIVTHGFTLRVFLMRWFHFTVEQFESLTNPANAEVIVLKRSGPEDDAPYYYPQGLLP